MKLSWELELAVTGTDSEYRDGICGGAAPGRAPHAQAEDCNGRPGFMHTTRKRYTPRCGGAGRGGAAARGRGRVPKGGGRYVYWFGNHCSSFVAGCSWELNE